MAVAVAFALALTLALTLALALALALARQVPEQAPQLARGRRLLGAADGARAAIAHAGPAAPPATAGGGALRVSRGLLAQRRPEGARGDQRGSMGSMGRITQCTD